MKVTQVIPSIAAESSGPSYYMKHMIDVLRNHGVDVSLRTLEQYPKRWSPIPNLGRSPDMFRALRDDVNYCDIVHSNSLWMMPNLYPYWAAKGKSVRVVTSPHGTLSKWALRHGRLKKKLFGVFLQYPALRRTDMWHATCEKEYNEIRNAGYNQPVAIIPIGIDLPLVGNLRNGIRKKVAFFGRLHKVKAVDNLVLAWGRIADRFPNWDLEIAGPDGGILDSLTALITTHRIPRVKFVGEINGPAKYEFLSSADLYVLPSHTENFGVTVAEALACGTPTIASEGTPWRGLNENGCGWCIPIGVEPLVKQLTESLSSSAETLSSMGIRGRDWMKRDFAWNVIGQRMKMAYEWLLDPNTIETPDWVIIN